MMSASTAYGIMIPNKLARIGSAEGIQAPMMETAMQRFTVYRRNLSARGTHDSHQANDDSEPQWEGVIWSDKTVTIRWLTPCGSHAIWSRIEDCLAIHGHPEYGTEIIWHDGPAPECWIKAVAKYEAAKP